ncbi:hypothetical protein VZT92_017821 [Zoarces viviparus]|uniref:Uncharacterized protein n=1 Tax=Zoarces viviparus TaxID=48416 RepID=A0AAW1EPJ3_ZOAVI
MLHMCLKKIYYIKEGIFPFMHVAPCTIPLRLPCCIYGSSTCGGRDQRAPYRSHCHSVFSARSAARTSRSCFLAPHPPPNLESSADKKKKLPYPTRSEQTLQLSTRPFRPSAKAARVR